jgi:hypothetical protein
MATEASPKDARVPRPPELLGMSEKLRSAILARAAELSVHPGRPELTAHPNATIVRAVLDRPKTYFGGVFDEHGQIIAASRVVRGPSAECFCGHFGHRSPKPDVERPEQAVYGGLAFKQFGHFILECLSRLWAVKPGAGRPHIYIQCRGTKPPEFGTRLYELAGVSAAIRVASRATRFDRVLVPAPSFVGRRSAHRAFKDLCLRIADRALASRRPSVTEQPVYLSRARLGATRRALLGFAVVHPETLDITEQIRLVNSHRFVVGPVGSALHLLLFSALSNDVVYLTGGSLNANFLLCDALNATHAAYLKTATQPAVLDHPAIGGNRLPWLLDLETTVSCLRERGLIGAAQVDLGDRTQLLQEYRRRYLLEALLEAARLRNPELLHLAQSYASRRFPGDRELERQAADAAAVLGADASHKRGCV